MTFEVLNQLGVSVCITTYENCVYDLHDLQAMAKAGYSFRVDGKHYKVPIEARKAAENSCKGGSTGCIKPNTSSSNSTKAQSDSSSLETDISSTNSLNNSESESTTGTVKIRCVETGELFDKQSQAARYYKIDPAAVSDSIKTGRVRSGYTFEKVIV